MIALPSADVVHIPDEAPQAPHVGRVPLDTRHVLDPPSASLSKLPEASL